MVDEHKPAVLRGFDIAVADIGDELHLCHPLLSFEGDDTLYVARRLNWQNDRKALAVADPSEASDLGTLLPDTHERAIASGEAVITVGTGFVQAAKAAGVQLDGFGMIFARVRDAECRIDIATPESFAKLKTRLADEARTAFDEELGDAARRERHLSERGNAALLLLRRCGPRRRDDLAIRQLAGARQNRELDLYRRLLIRFALELDTQQSDLDEKTERHIALASESLAYTTTLDLSPGQKYRNLSKLYAGAVMEFLIYANSRIRRLERDFEKFPYERIRMSSQKVSTSKFHLPAMIWEEIPDQHLPMSGGIIPDAEFSPPIGGSKSPVTVRLHSGGFGEGIQRDSEDVHLIPAYLKKYQQSPLNPKVSVESPRSGVQRAEKWRNSGYITMSRALRKLPKKYSVMSYPYPRLELQNQVSTEFWKMIRAKTANDHLPGDVTSIQATKDEQTKAIWSFPGRSYPLQTTVS